MLRRSLLALAMLAMAPFAGAAAPGDVIVHEIMKNPRAVFDSAGEWFELRNVTAAGIDINGWTIKDVNATPNLHVIANGGPLVVPASGYLVLGNNRNSLTNGGLTVHYQYPSSWQLGNSGDAVLLVDPAGVEIDRVQYDTTTFPNPDGSSMALRHPSLDNTVGANWCQAGTPYGAGDKGTPGAANDCPGELCTNGTDDDFDGLVDCADSDCSSQLSCLAQAYVVEAPASVVGECAGPGTRVELAGRALRGGIVVNEIMINPTAADDAVGEWVELFNRTAEPIDIGGWRLRDFGADSHVITGSLVVMPGESVVIGASAVPAVNGGAPVAQQWSNVFLGNQGDQLVLIDDSDRIVDSVAWDQLTFPIGAGGSISLRNVDLDNALGVNWCLSSTPFGAGDKGTPGGDNACGAVSTAPGSVVITELLKDPARVADATGEWIELLNRTALPIDIDGWTLRDDGTDLHVIDNGGPLMIPAGGRILLGASTDPAVNGGVTVAYRWSGFFVANDDDEIALLDLALNEVDRVAYDNGATFPDTVGASLGLRADDLDNSLGASWCISRTPFGAGDRGTPGAASDCSGTVGETGFVLEWTSTCSGAAFTDSASAWTTLALDPDSCVTRCTATITLEGAEPPDAVVDITVLDTQAPVVILVPATAHDLWPPNHRMECFTIDELALLAQDACGGPVRWSIASCTSSQPDDAAGDGSTEPDCVIADDGRSVCVRAERPGVERSGRLYSASAVATDECGNASGPVVAGTFVVEHDRKAMRPAPRGPARRRP